MSLNDDVRFTRQSRPREALVLLLSIYRLRGLPIELPFSFFKTGARSMGVCSRSIRTVNGDLSRYDDDIYVKRVAVSSLHAFVRTASLKVSVLFDVIVIGNFPFGRIKPQSAVIVV